MPSVKANTEAGVALATPQPGPALGPEIREVLLRKLSVRVESDELDLFRAGILDSMGLVQFIFALEEHFQLRLPLEEIDTGHFVSVAKVAEFISAFGQRAASGEP
jgi:acyl carrier protein